MKNLDLEQFLAEISSESPCGEDLEYDPEFGEMERAAQGKPEQQIGNTLVPAEEADWPAVRASAISLFDRTRDLRVAVYLTRSLLHTEGLIGLTDGLLLIQGLLEKYWESVHPQLDPADNNDPTLRINTLLALSDPESVLHSIREAILVKSAALGRFTLRDILIATGRFSAPARSDEEPAEISTINAAFMDASLEDLKDTADAVRQSIECVSGIESVLMDQVGSKQMADFSPLLILLKEAQHIMAEHLTLRGAGEADASAEADSDAPAKQAPAQSLPNAINSQEDVIRALDMVCEYFRKNEPSSPVPLLLQRAKRLVAKDFLDILRDLTPAGVTQAEEIGGISQK